jgi:Multiubiquitin
MSAYPCCCGYTCSNIAGGRRPRETSSQSAGSASSISLATEISWRLRRRSEDEHFYSQKAITIIVNGQKKEVTETRLSYDQVAKLAFPVPPPGQNIMYLIGYRHGPPANPKGSLLEGETVRIKNEMIFDVTPTDRS